MSGREIADLVARGDIEALRAIAEGGDKERAKAARAGLHALRTKGHKDAVPRPASRAPAPVAAPREELPCWASSVDSAGDSVICLVRPKAGGGLEIYEGQLNEERGILAFAGTEMSRKEAREFVAELRKVLPVAPLPWRVAQAWLEEAYAHNLAGGRSVPAEFARARRVLGKPEPLERHPALELWPEAPEVPREAILALHDTRECLPWIPPRDRLERTSLQIMEIDTSRVLLGEEQKKQAMNDAIARAMTEYFAIVAVRQHYHRRLLDVAYLIHQAGSREGEARAARAAAEEFGAEGLIPEEGNFARRLFEKCFRFSAVKEADPGDSESPLILVP